MLEIRLLGAVEVASRVPGDSRRRIPLTAKERAFVTYLATTGQPQSRERLAELFWPERSSDQSLANLRVLLTRLRKKLGDSLDSGGLDIGGDSVAISEHTRVDVLQLHRSLDALDQSLEAAPETQAALGMVRGILAPGVGVTGSLAFDDWLDEQRAGLTRRIATARRILFDLAWRSKDFEAAVKQSARLVEDDPLDEDACRRHMYALLRSGCRGEALDCFAACREALAADLGIDPEPETLALAKRISQRSQPLTIPGFGLIDRRAKAMLLEHVRRFWIERILEPSRPAAGEIQVRQRRRLDLIQDPWADVRHYVSTDPAGSDPAGAESAAAELSDESHLSIFEQSGGAMLITGEAGSGKTFRLLELARQALKRAENDAEAPLPMVLHLGSWPSVGGCSLPSWVAQEARGRYHLPENLVARWLKHGALILLLDGLDELPPGPRLDCLEAVHRSRGSGDLIPLAMCCRSAALEEVASLSFQSPFDEAIELLPLTSQQVDQAFDSAFEDGTSGLRRDQDPAWSEVLSNPLMLSLTIEATQSSAAQPPANAATTAPGNLSIETRRHRLLGEYVRLMLSRQDEFRLSEQALAATLGVLATGMQRGHEAVFQLDRLQPTWLSGRYRRAYLLVSRLLCAAVLGALVSSLAILVGRPSPLVVRIFAASLWAGGLLFVVDSLRLGRPPPSRGERFAWFMAATIAVSMIGWWQTSQIEQRSRFGALVLGLAISSLLVWRPTKPAWHSDIQPTGAITWSLKVALQSVWLGIGLGAALGTVRWLDYEWRLQDGDWWSWASGPMIILGLFGSLVGGLRETVALPANRPNYGIWLSTRSAVFSALVITLGFSASLFAVLILLRPVFQQAGSRPFRVLRSYNLELGWHLLPVLALSFGCYAFLWYGGIETLKHWILRAFLWLQHRLPIRLEPILEAGAACGLLRHQLNGTVFRHRAVLEYFVARKSP